MIIGLCHQCHRVKSHVADSTIFSHGIEEGQNGTSGLPSTERERMRKKIEKERREGSK